MTTAFLIGCLFSACAIIGGLAGLVYLLKKERDEARKEWGLAIGFARNLGLMFDEQTARVVRYQELVKRLQGLKAAQKIVEEKWK